jgi:hypothetical protein
MKLKSKYINYNIRFLKLLLQRNLKKKKNGVKNARPVHVSETWEQIVILGSS